MISTYALLLEVMIATDVFNSSLLRYHTVFNSDESVVSDNIDLRLVVTVTDGNSDCAVGGGLVQVAEPRHVVCGDEPGGPQGRVNLFLCFLDELRVRYGG
jgi:hypothetical protein